MVKKTDMDGIKSVARTFLMLEPQETEYAPMIIKHPFTDSGIVPALKDDSNPVGVANIMEDEKALAAWREQMRKQIDRIDSPHSLILMLTKSYFCPLSNMQSHIYRRKIFQSFCLTHGHCVKRPTAIPTLRNGSCSDSLRRRHRNTL